MTKLETIRRRRKLSPAQLAVKAEVSERTILNHEGGYGYPARPKVQARIAEALGVKPQTIFKEGLARND